MKIYISGKITGTTDYVERFEKAEEFLKENYPDAEIINPVNTSLTLPESTTYQQYMKLSLCLLDMCDTIYMMDGWDDSNGASLEFQYALAMGYKTMHELAERRK